MSFVMNHRSETVHIRASSHRIRSYLGATIRSVVVAGMLSFTRSLSTVYSTRSVKPKTIRPLTETGMLATKKMSPEVSYIEETPSLVVPP